MKNFAIVYGICVTVMSAVAFLTYGFDKHRAKKDGRRVPEKTLHIMALLGGWPGAMFAQRIFRHKTQKTGFQLVFWGSVVLNLLALCFGLYLTWDA